MEYCELSQNSTITSVPMGLPILVDTSMNNRVEERSLGNAQTYTWSVYPGKDCFAFSRSYPPFDIYGKHSTWKGLRTTYDAHVSNISIQLLRRNLSNQSSDDRKARFLISILVAWLNQRVSFDHYGIWQTEKSFVVFLLLLSLKFVIYHNWLSYSYVAVIFVYLRTISLHFLT